MTVVVDEAALEGFDTLPGGPALAAGIERADPTTMIGQDTAAWMRAGFRVRNHADWLLLRALREACRSRADTTVRIDDEFAPKIAAANLGWSATTAATRLEVAVGILERIPALGERMRTGALELAKATAFVTGLDGLTDTQCAAVVAGLLDEAPDLPLGQLRDRILDAGYAIDRVWAANRLAAATARARVTRESAPSGAVNLCGRDLDPELAQDAAHRLRALALAVRRQLRALGRKLPLGYIEARVFIRLMDGTHAGATETEMITAVTTELAEADGPHTSPGDSPDPDSPDPDDDRPDGSGPDDGRPDDNGGPGDPGPDDSGPDVGAGDPGPDDSGPDDSGPDDSGPDDAGPDDGGPNDVDPDDSPPVDLDHDSDEPEPEPERGADRSEANPPESGTTAPDDSASAATENDPPLTSASSSGPRHSVEFPPGNALRLPLSTLLGLDHRPGTLPGTGPVPADTARTAARSYGAATWQVLVHDQQGHLTHLLTLRAPPGADRDPRHRRETVQITAPAELIHALDPDAEGTLELLGVHAVLLDQATTRWLRHARDALERSETADSEDHPATTSRDRDRRFPGAALARWVQARDQTCIALGCSRPAAGCDIDHTLDWIFGGVTEAGDLDLLCRHDHRAKHEGGWDYRQPEPGRFLITDPTGTRHHVESRVVHPLPAPCSPGHGISPEPYHPRTRPDWAPNRTRDGRITDEARATAEHLPAAPTDTDQPHPAATTTTPTSDEPGFRSRTAPARAAGVGRGSGTRPAARARGCRPPRDRQRTG